MTRASLVAIVLVAGCGGAPANPAVDRPALASGAQLYATYCDLCHGDEGQGYAADDANALRNETFLATASDEFLRDSILFGRPGTAMAAYGERAGGPLGAGDVDRLVAFIRAWQAGPSVATPEVAPGDAEAAAPVYAAQCAACHGDRGQGETALSLNNPRFLASASDGFLRYAIEHGRPGTPMMAYGGSLTGSQMDDLVALLRSWQRPVEEPGAPVRPALARQVVINPDGPHAELQLREGRFAPAAQVHEAFAGGRRLVILDARAPSDFHLGHIPGAVSTPYYHVDEVADLLPRDGTWIIAYCGCPHAASGRVVDALRDRGFERTAVLDEGVFHWHEQGWPMTTPQSVDPAILPSPAE